MARVAKRTRKSTAKKAVKKAARKATTKAVKRTAKSSMAPAKRARKAAKTATKSTSRKVPSRKIPGISRVDQDSTRTHGWVVRLKYEQTPSGWRPKHTAYFGDATHGSPTKSLAAAEEYLKKLQKGSKKGK